MSACGCKKYCTDLPEHKDDPNAQCKGLPLKPRPALVIVDLKPR